MYQIAMKHLFAPALLLSDNDMANNIELMAKAIIVAKQPRETDKCLNCYSELCPTLSVRVVDTVIIETMQVLLHGKLQSG
jgi:hypothetical protein